MTEEADFHLPDGRTARVPMMHQSGEYEYYENEDLQIVALPYKGSRLDMCIILPREGKDYAQVLAGLDSSKWRQLTVYMTTYKGDIALPRFKVAYEKELSNTLTALGMGNAFAGGFDDIFGDVVNDSAFISKVLQKTWMEVNEEGTVAAASTELDMKLNSISDQPLTMTVDRPFIFAIRDNRTEAPLFLGTIVSP